MLSLPLILLLATSDATTAAETLANPPLALRAPTNKCGPQEFFRRHSRDPIMTINELESENGTLYALFFIAGFSPDGTGLFQRGAFYFHLDDQPSIYEQYPPNRLEDKGYFISLRFSGVANGNHRIAYAIVTRPGQFVAYGQRCFVIHSRRREFFHIRRIMQIFGPK